MSTYLAKRKGMSFYRITDKGKTIKDYSYSELRSLLRKEFSDKNSAINSIKDKSFLWKLCIDNNLI